MFPMPKAASGPRNLSVTLIGRAAAGSVGLSTLFAIVSPSAITISLQDLFSITLRLVGSSNQSAVNPVPGRGQCAGFFFATSDILHPNLSQYCINVASVIVIAR
jgi:hypothetical protein